MNKIINRMETIIPKILSSWTSCQASTVCVNVIINWMNVHPCKSIFGIEPKMISYHVLFTENGRILLSRTTNRYPVMNDAIVATMNDVGVANKYDINHKILKILADT